MSKKTAPTRPDYNGPSMPGFIRHESRICFGIDYFDSEDAAQAAVKAVRAAGLTYNSGFFDKMPCGRASQFDHVVDGRKLYAVTC